jgi:hypothetical protein
MIGGKENRLPHWQAIKTLKSEEKIDFKRGVIIAISRPP